MSQLDTFIARAQSQGHAHIYAPETPSDPLSNLGNLALPDGALEDGAALSTGEAEWTGPPHESASVLTPLDGGAQRTNHCISPLGDSATGIGQWAPFSGRGIPTWDEAPDGTSCMKVTRDAEGQGLVNISGGGQIPTTNGDWIVQIMRVWVPAADWDGGHPFPNDANALAPRTIEAEQQGTLRDQWQWIYRLYKRTESGDATARTRLDEEGSSSSEGSFFFVSHAAELNCGQTKPDLSDGGAALFFPTSVQLADGLVEGGVSAVLDSVKAHIDTGWETRTNPVANPSAALSNTAKVGTQAVNCEILINARVESGLSEWGWAFHRKFKATASSVYALFRPLSEGGDKLPVSGSTEYTFLFRASAIQNLAARNVELILREHDAEGTLIKQTLGGQLAVGDHDIAVVFTTQANAATVDVSFGAQAAAASAGEEIEYKVTDGALVKGNVSTTDFFPKPAQLEPFDPAKPESGLASFTGPDHESASDIGPFARGADRTYGGPIQRSSTSTVDTVFGSSDGTVRIQAAAGSDDVTATFDGGTTTATWEGALSGTEAAFVIVRLVGSIATLFVDGVPVGDKEVTRAQASGTMLLGAHGEAADPMHGLEIPFGTALGGLSAAEILALSDLTAPDTTILTGPDGITADTKATFTFEADEEAATFEARLDGGEWAAAESPFVTPTLGQGWHTFEVRAIDEAGNADPTPAWFGWHVHTAGVGSASEATIAPTPAIPKLRVPLRLENGRLGVCEQGSQENVAACVYAALAYERGSRIEDPEFGIEDPTFEQMPIDVDEWLAQIAAYEPRADVQTSQEVGDLIGAVLVEVGRGT